MATKCSVRSIERMLESNGVVEGRHTPYMTSARTMFAQMAYDALKGAQPTDGQMLQMVRNSGAFIGALWHAQRTGAANPVPVLDFAEACWNGAGETTLTFRGAYHSGTKHRMASIISKTPATPGRHRPEVVDAAYERATALAPVAQGIVENAMGGPFPTKLKAGSRKAWGSATLTGQIDGRTVNVAIWTVNELVHRSDEDLLHRVRQFHGEVFDGSRRLALFRSVVPDIQERLDAIVALSRLPITLGIAQDVGRSAYKDASGDVWIVLDGYGPGGLAARRDLRTFSSKTVLDGRLDVDLGQYVDEQRRLHKMYGPTPGGDRIKWTIDAVTARLGVTADHVEQCIEKGSCAIREGVKIRIAGKRILGEVAISPDVLWRGDEIRAAGISVPTSVMTAVVGKDVTEVVGSDMLTGGGTITSARANTLRHRPRLNLRIRPAMVPVPTETTETT